MVFISVAQDSRQVFATVIWDILADPPQANVPHAANARRIHKLVEGALACAQDDVWQTPEMWLKSDLTGLDELELMWTQIQQELKTKGTAHGNN